MAIGILQRSASAPLQPDMGGKESRMGGADKQKAGAGGGGWGAMRCGDLLKSAPLLLCLLVFAWSMSSLHQSNKLRQLRSGMAACESADKHGLASLTAGALGALSPVLQQATPSLKLLGGGSEAAAAARQKARLLMAGGDLRAGLDWAPEGPSITLFCAPKPYTGLPDDNQRRALLSWVHLTPPLKIVLFGKDPSFFALAKEFPGHVFVEPYIDYNFYGVPLFHSMLTRAQAADTDVSMVINGDILLLNDLLPAVQKVHRFFDNWLLTAARWDVNESFPYAFEAADVGTGTARTAREEEIKAYTREHGSLHTYGGVDFWMWNNSPVPLYKGTMPPFFFGRGKYDNWLTHEAEVAGMRAVVDASDAVTSIHVAHSYAHVADAVGTKKGEKVSFWSTRKKSSWELFANIHMAQSVGTYTNQKGTAVHTSWRLASCHEPAANNMCLLKRKRPANCTCEYSAYAMKTQSDAALRDGRWVCGSVSVDRKQEYTIQAAPSNKSTLGLPHTMEQLLPQVARSVGDLKVVTLVAVTMGYFQMLMNFACSLNRLGVGSNLVVAALDEELYKAAYLQGLAVYYERASDGLKAIDSANCAFGSQCFRQFTKLKSRAVLRVLKAGFSVLWTDVDIVWYKDPLPHLMSYGPGTFPIQSNEPKAELPGTGIRRINSGFYFARADKMTVDGFVAITEHAAKTKLSEQPSFYDVLCGVKGELLVMGKEECVWKNGLRTIFLDRAMYPNGAVHSFWNASDVTAACRAKGCTILHNNWISGKDAKKQRLVVNGYWHFLPEQRMCKHDWHANLKLLRAEDVPTNPLPTSVLSR